MRFLVAVLLTIGFLLTIVGCVNMDSGQQGGGGTEKFLLKMDLSDVMSGESITTKSFKNGSDPEYYFLYVQLIDGGRIGFNYQKIDSPDFTIELDKDAVYLFAIAERKQNNEEIKGIKTLGVIMSEKLGSAIFPISSSAAAVIDLGKIIKKGDVLYTTIEATKLLSDIGYTEEYIKSLKGYDTTLTHLLSNQDINQDGIFDKDQGLEWSLTPAFDFQYRDKNYYDQNNNVNFDSLPPPEINRIGLVFWIRWNELKKIDSNAKNWNCYLKNNVLENFESYHQGNEPSNYPTERQWFQFYFDFNKDREKLASGSYIFKLSCKTKEYNLELRIDNVSFLITPESELFVIPILNVKAYSNGKLESISWEWKRYENGQYVDVDEKAVKLLLKDRYNFFFYTFHETPVYLVDQKEREFKTITPAEHGIEPWRNATFNSIETNYWLYSPISYSGVDPAMLRCAFWDIGMNCISNYTVVNYYEYPHDFDEGAQVTTTLDISSDLYLINLKYSKENRYTDTGKFGGIVIKKADNQNSTMLLYETLWPHEEELTNRMHRVQASIEFENPGKIKFNINNVDYYLTYQVVYNGKSQGYIGYIEGNISTEGYPTEVNRNSDNYVIYSIFKK